MKKITLALGFALAASPALAETDAASKAAPTAVETAVVNTLSPGVAESSAAIKDTMKASILLLAILAEMGG